MNERDIFIEAMQRPAKERSAFLNEACGKDRKLRERVNALLNEELDSFLDGPAYELKDTPSSSNAQQNIDKV